MNLERSPHQEANALARIRSMMRGSRTPGIHVSDLVGCLRQAWARRHNLISTELEDLSPSTVLLFATGRAIQDYITGKPEEGEFTDCVDGIHGSIDYRDYFVDAEGLPWEVKCTYASAAHNILDTPHYFDQLACYVYMLRKTMGYLAVYYVNGYYNTLRRTPHPDSQPGERSVLRVYRVEFTQQELDEHWRRMTSRRDILLQATSLQDIPLQLHYTWHCEYCPIRGTHCEGGDGNYKNHWIG